MLSPFMGSIAQNVIVLQVVRSDTVLRTVMRLRRDAMRSLSHEVRIIPGGCITFPEGTHHAQRISAFPKLSVD